MKNILHNLIDKVLNNRYVNIYGESFCGKTKICFELCKYFYMNNLFKEGIYYINLKKINNIEYVKELKDLWKKNDIINKRINNDTINNDIINIDTINNDKINNVLLVFDNFEYAKEKRLFSYVNSININTHCIIVSKDNLKNLKLEKEIIFENLDVPIKPEFAKELINYSKIIKNPSDIIINEKNYANKEIYAKEIFKKLRTRIDEKKKENNI